MVKMIKEAVPVDGFLGDLHALLLMDDTVILATSREMCINKFKVVLDYCEEYGMEINEKKTKFMVINHSEEDKAPLKIRNRTIDYCEKYLYLGSWFTDDGNQKSMLKLHEPAQTLTLNKFTIFCNVNTEMPYFYKSLVMDAAVISSIFYSCETWLGSHPEYAINTYNKLLRILLGVRETTSIEMSLVESGKQPAKYLLKERQKQFITKKMQNRDMEEPFQKAYEMCKNANTPGYKFLQKLTRDSPDIESLEICVNKIRNKPLTFTKFVTYRTELNPELNSHAVYGKATYIPDYLRASFTRLRLMSHRLKVETGRWSRTERSRRVCQCDRTSVQDESHVLLTCRISAQLREEFRTLSFTSISSLFESHDMFNMCRYINKVLKLYE